MMTKKLSVISMIIILLMFSIQLNAEDKTEEDLSTSVKIEGQPEIYMAPGVRQNAELEKEEKEEVAEDQLITQQMLNATRNNQVPLEYTIDVVTLKLLRGITNIATGWGEIPRQLCLSAKNDHILLILPLGLSRGIALTVARTLVGVAETSLFFYSLDGTYGPVMNPSFVWQKDDINPREQYPPTK